MTSKPRSGRALCLSVAHCSHPDLDPTDKALLGYLAVNADYETGRNSRPGNPSLCDATTLKRSALNDRLEKNIQRKLIERTTVGDGRGKASAYRIRIESSLFPDQTPSGEWLIEKVSGSGRTDSENKPSGPARTDSTQTVQQSQGNCPAESGNRPADNGKLSGQLAETVRELPEDTRSSPETHQTTTNQPPAQNPQTESVRRKAVDGWISSQYATMGAPDKPIRQRLEDIAAQNGKFGLDILKKALQIFFNRPKGLDGLKCPWRAFLNEIGACAAQAKEQCKRHDWRFEHDAEYRAFIEADLKRQNREYVSTLDYIADVDARFATEQAERRAVNDPVTIATFPTAPIKIQHDPIQEFLESE